MGWQSVSFWIEYSFGLLTGSLFGFSVIILIGLIIMRCLIARLMRIGHGSLILLMIDHEGAAHVTNSNKLGALFGTAHVCGKGGYHTLYVEVPEEID